MLQNGRFVLVRVGKLDVTKLFHTKRETGKSFYPTTSTYNAKIEEIEENKDGRKQQEGYASDPMKIRKQQAIDYSYFFQTSTARIYRNPAL